MYLTIYYERGLEKKSMGTVQLFANFSTSLIFFFLRVRLSVFEMSDQNHPQVLRKNTGQLQERHCTVTSECIFVQITPGLRAPSSFLCTKLNSSTASGCEDQVYAHRMASTR